MLARLAENLFWCGRYLVRAEDTARMVDVTWHMLLEAAPTAAARSWEDLLDVLHQTEAYAASADGSDLVVAIRPDDVLRWLVSERENPGSVFSSALGARENARSVRELVSSEFWECVNDLHLKMHRRDLRGELGDQPYDLFKTVKLSCQTIVGVAQETMPRDEAYLFLQLGRALERAEMTARLVSVRWAQAEDDPSFQPWGTLLRSVGAMEAFRKRRPGSTDPRDVIGLLVLDGQLPRSVLFALQKAEAQLERIGSRDDGMSARRLGRARAALEYRDVHEVLDIGLEAMMERMQSEIREVTDAITQEYFRHAPTGSMHTVGAA
jgi:uncharacterized alpha-E superfamily protein